jgi:hypothetical protein
VLTTDMTGRNLQPRRNIAEIDDVLSRVKAFGYYSL